MIDLIGLLQRLIRIDTTNPPGNETPAAEALAAALKTEGLEAAFFARDPLRANMMVRIPGRGLAPPLLMQGHLDVVPSVDQRWDHDPFGGEIIDGYLWGRGSIDMKVALVMMADALVRSHNAATPPPGDVILLALADEEDGGAFGAQFMVEEHPDLFEGVRHAIGEFGGFPLPIAGKTFRPVQVAERIPVAFTATVEGPGGHGSLPVLNGAARKLGRMLNALDQGRTPIRITEATRLMIEGLVANTSGISKLALRSLLHPRTARPALWLLSKDLGAFETILRNTANPTIIRAGEKQNVHPAKAVVTLDGRMLPECTPEEMAAELQAIVGPEVRLEFETEQLGPPPDLDMTLFPLLAEILSELYPDSIPIPFLLPAVTDGRWFGQLGIQHYGFMPLDLPVEFDFIASVHGANERVPVDGMTKGAEAIFQLIQRYSG